MGHSTARFSVASIFNRDFRVHHKNFWSNWKNQRDELNLDSALEKQPQREIQNEADVQGLTIGSNTWLGKKDLLQVFLPVLFGRIAYKFLGKK